MADDNVISLDNVGKTYGAFKALADVTLNVRRGEKVVVCGP